MKLKFLHIKSVTFCHIYKMTTNSSPKENQICPVCHKLSDKLKWCGKCKAVKYCSAECQSKDWGFHKLNCQFLQEKDMKTIVSDIRSFTTQKMKCFLFAYSYYCKYILFKQALLILVKEEREMIGKLVTTDEPDIHILKDTVGTSIRYSTVDFAYGTTISCSTQHSLKCYDIYKDLFKPKVSIIVTSTSVDTKSTLLERIIIKSDDDDDEFFINL